MATHTKMPPNEANTLSAIDIERSKIAQAAEPPMSTLSTSPSDDDRTSGNASSRSNSPNRGESRSSSVSDLMPDEEESGRTVNHANSTPEQAVGELKPAMSKELEVMPPPRSRSSTVRSGQSEGVQRLTAAEIQQLTSSPDSLPIAPAPPHGASLDQELITKFQAGHDARRPHHNHRNHDSRAVAGSEAAETQKPRDRECWAPTSSSHRTVSTPPVTRDSSYERPRNGNSSPRRNSANPLTRPAPPSIALDGAIGGFGPPLAGSAIQRGPSPVPGPSQHLADVSHSRTRTASAPPSPMLQTIPLPPMSLPTHLQLELAAQRPSPLYIHQPYTDEMPYESSAVKIERLKNILMLPPVLERTLYFGALACLDAWLHNFTILPMRFIIALVILVKWWAYVAGKETGWLLSFVKEGLGRLWERGRTGRSRAPSEATDMSRDRSQSGTSQASNDFEAVSSSGTAYDRRPGVGSRRGSRAGVNHLKPPFQPRLSDSRKGIFRHKRTGSMPSTLSVFHKADLLQGAVIICSSIALMSLDASRMYHFIRAQSAIKLYVIYNILEVGDRLLSAIGQDILECLFSTETLSRNASGRSKVLLPLGMFVLALVYNCLHSVALYYQVITLNVAVNSYSNALLTLLLSNQFVEIKSTVFKRFEKDNLFQLTCADIVERFHLWIMLLIIGMRNVVEVGGLSVPGAGKDSGMDDASTAGLHSSSILPHSFTVLPAWLKSGEVLSPFLIVIGSEMLVDTIKHAYVTKFNNIKPKFYSRILDILCKDYYTNAFTTPSLTRRLGLAVIPLSCLFIRASVQTYHMFLSTHLSMPMPQSTQTSLSEESAVPSSPAMLAALTRFDTLLRDSLGRATYGYPYGSPLNQRPWYAWTSDDFIAAITMVVFFFIAFLVLLMIKLLLGLVLLKYSRERYHRMKAKEHAMATGKADMESYDTNGRRVGAHGEVEVGDERQRWIHADKTEGLKGGRGPGGKKAAGVEDGKKKMEADYSGNGVARFEMVNKRIW